MIDFIRARIDDRSGLVDLLENRENFPNVFANVNIHGGEIAYPVKTRMNNMEFRITEGSAYVQNSLHILNNELLYGENQNFNDFNYSELCSCIEHLAGRVPKTLDATLTQLEFGFNIHTSRSPSDIIKNNILMHDLNAHSLDKTFKGSGALKRFDHANYQVKIYDKGRQSLLPDDLMRFEVRLNRSAELRNLNVWKIGDLTDKKVLNDLFNYTMKRFEGLTIVDTIPFKSDVTLEERTQISEYRSYDYWNSLSKRSQRNLKAKHKVRFDFLIHKHNLLSTKYELKDSLIKKYRELIN